MPLAFEWDKRKAEANWKKHSVRFAEAASVFSDPQARIFQDEDHSGEETREIIIGYSLAKHLLLVCFTEIEQERIRIISARRAVRRERRDYEERGTI
jgi:uncharacterized DUF497 family protein